MRRIVWWFSGVTAIVATTFLALSPERTAQAKPTDDQVSKFMREKLEAADKVLEGLVTEDFDLIREGAEKMLAMSKATEWVVIQGPVYAQHSAEFRRNVEQLLKMTKEKNLDGAALSHMQVTMSCLNCHKFVRSTKIAANDRPAPSQQVAVSH